METEGIFSLTLKTTNMNDVDSTSVGIYFYFSQFFIIFFLKRSYPHQQVGDKKMPPIYWGLFFSLDTKTKL